MIKHREVDTPRWSFYGFLFPYFDGWGAKDSNLNERIQRQAVRGLERTLASLPIGERPSLCATLSIASMGVHRLGCKVGCSEQTVVAL